MSDPDPMQLGFCTDTSMNYSQCHDSQSGTLIMIWIEISITISCLAEVNVLLWLIADFSYVYFHHGHLVEPQMIRSMN